MATRDVFLDEELARLRGFPEISRAELIRYFTLMPADEAFVRKVRGRGNVLGAGMQLCALPWLGFVPDEVGAAPAAAVARLSERLGIPVGELRGYGEREQTRTDHLREIVGYLGWRTMDAVAWKDLEEFLFARAMEHDSPKLLFRQSCEYLASSRVVRPGVVHLLTRIAMARVRAREETWTRVAHLLDERRRGELDGLLAVDPTLGRTRLAWLGTGPTSATPAALKAKLAYLRRLDAHTLDLAMLPAERRRFLAGVGRRLTGQALSRREPERRSPILLALLAQSAVDVLDETLLLFDQALSAGESAAKVKLREALADRGRSGEDRQALLEEMLAIVLDPQISAERIGAALHERVGTQRMRSAWEARRERLPRDHGHLALRDASVAYLRHFAPDVLAATRARKVPADPPTGFMPARWVGYLPAASAAGEITGYRHYGELCVLLGWRDGLRFGDG